MNNNAPEPFSFPWVRVIGLVVAVLILLIVQLIVAPLLNLSSNQVVGWGVLGGSAVGLIIVIIFDKSEDVL